MRLQCDAGRAARLETQTGDRMQEHGNRLIALLAIVAALALLSIVLFSGRPGSVAGTGSTTSAPDGIATPPTSAASPFILVGAGDIASCSSNGDEATADLLETIPGIVFTTGDNVYDNGTPSEFRDCYGPSWGRPPIKARTRPTPGNHDYNTPSATGYFGYFGAAAGDPATGYYAYDAGTWRVYVLNSNCAAIGGCDAGSPEEQWLRADLAANSRACVLAMWHHPRYSSGLEHGSSTATEALYQALYDFNTELILAGHDHDYERFAPMTATGTIDDARGIVQFVVGTGGKSHYPFGTPQTGSFVRNNDTYGVLRLAPGTRLVDLPVHSPGGQDLHRLGRGDVPLSRRSD
jgi:hypothetical protein